MSAPKLLLSKLLRRRRYTHTLSSFSISSSLSLFTPSHHNTDAPHNHGTKTFQHNLHFPSSIGPYSFFYSRSFSTRDDSDYGGVNLSDDSAATQSEEILDPGLGGGQEIAETVAGASESILPVRAVISLLDGYHDLTGLPWWIIIASSTLALRITLFPILILQLRKLQRIAELFPKLPPPLPPPLSGRSYIDHISFFLKEKRAVGCPSYLWFLAFFSVQVPCFFLWMASIRRMSLDHHPGFDFGGTLWFQNLTELPHGIVGSIFPLLIAGLHFVNVQISFRSSSIGKANGLFGLLAKGSLVYWLTNSTLTLVQQLSLNHPGVRKSLGLPAKGEPAKAANREEKDTPGTTLLDPPRNQQKISVQNLSPPELLRLSIQLLAKGHKDRAIPLLRLALDKDPDYVRALVVMGQTLLQMGQPVEATEFLERAISKLFLIGHPTEVEEVDLLILASQWAGSAYVRQGKVADGIIHLQRIAHLKEPEDSKSKAHYYDGLLMLSSALYGEGRKVEAAKYLRLAAAYNPAYNEYLEQCEKEEDNFVSDLVSSRRRDY
ncbi:ALBINO3-like protein 2, chloroplastic isoform X2 [Cornus florida]|uniref:ALBINO3-like protein 2, chloroplastic isoform X2 n=1 Tax=Cornus florida TaxID=4283 RepID=UPI002899390B|nr:ALBINO3-like protein 2, chloroplastic isoform X2 [Cornus florida]